MNFDKKTTKIKKFSEAVRKKVNLDRLGMSPLEVNEILINAIDAKQSVAETVKDIEQQIEVRVRLGLGF